MARTIPSAASCRCLPRGVNPQQGNGPRRKLDSAEGDCPRAGMNAPAAMAPRARPRRVRRATDAAEAAGSPARRWALPVHERADPVEWGELLTPPRLARPHGDGPCQCTSAPSAASCPRCPTGSARAHRNESRRSSSRRVSASSRRARGYVALTKRPSLTAIVAADAARLTNSLHGFGLWLCRRRGGELVQHAVSTEQWRLLAGNVALTSGRVSPILRGARLWLDEVAGRIWGGIARRGREFVENVRVVPRNGVCSRATWLTSGRVSPILRGARLWLDGSAGRTWGGTAGEM
jgi:hypothetical protein